MLPDSDANRSPVMSFVITALLVYAAVCALLYFGQRSMIYYPTPEVRHDSAEDLRIDTKGASIQVWRVRGSGEDAVLYFGGNAEEVTWNIPEFRQDFSEHTLYLANYRGYGASTGAPSEMAILRDAEAVFDEIRDSHRSVTVMGRSLGSGVAVHLGTSKDVSRLVLVTPYDSLASVAASRFPVFPVSLLLKDRFESTRLASLIDIPTLIVAAEHDEVIPVRHARTLSETIRRDLVEFVVIENAGHNTIGEYADYRRLLTKFVQQDDREI